MALRDADKCIELKPQWFKGFSRRGDALFKLERYDEACDAYRDALERDPGNAAIQASLDQCKACCAPKKDTSFAWSQPNDPFSSSRSGAAGMSSRRAGGGGGGGGSGPSSLNNSKSAYELMDEFRVSAARANGSGSVPNAADYRERELEKFRSGRGGMKTSTASGGSDSLNASVNNSHNDTSFSSSRSAGGVESSAYSSGAAAAYQQSLLESYRRKKAMQNQDEEL
jgi:tetratricopeptide (TPR) repeat protein